MKRLIITGTGLSDVSKKSIRLSIGILLPFLMALIFCVTPSLAEDNDYPHNLVMGTSCNTGTCHSNYYGGTAPPVTTGSYSNTTFNEPGCLYCHDDTDPDGSNLTATTAIGHSSATTSTKHGTWTVTCIDCHHEHLQMQYWAYGTESFLVSGVSDPGGVTDNTLTMTGAGWEENSLVGMVLFPNIDDFEPHPTYPGYYSWRADWNNYGIIGNTLDTITVAGPMNLPQVGTGGNNFGVIYGNAINPVVPDQAPDGSPVKFFRSEGVNSFADGDATYDGICEVCHTQTSHHRKDGSAPYQSHYDGEKCTSCHSHANGFAAVAFDHTATGAVLADPTCTECHNDPDLVGGTHRNNCGLCHASGAGGGPLVEPLETNVPTGGDCLDCHGSVANAHDHTATPATGSIAVFPDNGHDDAGGPSFTATVDCNTCHASDLTAIHGNNCATCHPTPRETLTTWNGGCQQGGCHSVYHEDSTTAHLPFTDNNDCTLCHVQSSWAVTQSKCLNCHSAYVAGDLTPPVTTCDARAYYVGTAAIKFSIQDNGGVGIGTTFYRLDSGPTISAAEVVVEDGGNHTLEFWSIDQSGNVESPTNNVTFEVVLDNTPPTTTSNAKSSYYNYAQILLSATDDSSQGVKETYYKINGGTTQTGTTVYIPGTSGTSNYTLDFWSEDWSGNIETPKSVSFAVASGTANLRLIWWDSDVNPSHAPSCEYGDRASWVIRRGGYNYSYPIVASGSGNACNGWDGIDDYTLNVSPTRYYITIDWESGGWVDQSRGSVLVNTSGQIINFNY